jgi:hypothetical protein
MAILTMSERMATITMGTSEDDLRIRILDSQNQQSLRSLLVDHITNNEQFWKDDERSQRTLDLYFRQMELIRYDESKDKEMADWKRVRGSIEHENTLVNNRLTWLLLSQAALFTAFAAIYEHQDEAERTILTIIISLIGIVTCYDIYRVIGDAQKQLVHLGKWWDQTYKNDRPLDYRKHHPEIQRPLKRKKRMRRGNISLLFGIMWLLLFSTISIEGLKRLIEENSNHLLLSTIDGPSFENKLGWLLLITSGLILIGTTLLRPGLIRGCKVFQRTTRKRYFGDKREKALAEFNPISPPVPKEKPATHTK